MDGIIVVNKPKGCTSHDVVAKIRRKVQEKVGHTGTLDPMAQGVLPLLIGKGTLVSKYLVNHDKIYQVTLALGSKTDTADTEGEITETKEVPEEIWEGDKINSTLQTFLGKQKQTPPIYSAIKVKGKKLYEYARKGQAVDVPERDIEIYEMTLNEIRKESQEIVFTVFCGKGTYIRSLCEDIAEKLGTVGFMKELIRTKVGDFSLAESISLEEIDAVEKENLEQMIISLEMLFSKKPEIIILVGEEIPLFNGVKLKRELEDGVYRLYTEKHEFLGLGVLQNRQLKRDVILS